jgi:hypothetical protein
MSLGDQELPQVAREVVFAPLELVLDLQQVLGLEQVLRLQVGVELDANG